MARFRLITIISAALSSLVAFFVITRSGLAGTLAGAAVAAVVSTATSQWSGHGLEHAARRVRRKRIVKGVESRVAEARESDSPDATEAMRLEDARKTDWSLWREHPWLPVWISLVLVTLAIGASAYSLISGSPVERVVVQERVVERPIVQDRVVVEKVPSGALPLTPKAGPASTQPTSPSGVASTETTVSRESSSTTTTIPVSSTEGPTSSSTTTSIAKPADS